MKTHALIIVGCALCAMGCTEKPQETAGQTDEAVTEAAATVTEEPLNDAFLKHMHLHAEKLDDIGFALADGDLAAARTPAYWLSRHEEVEGVQPEWRQYLAGMRSSASAVEEATDLDTARAAAERITVECQGCHTAAGVATD